MVKKFDDIAFFDSINEAFAYQKRKRRRALYEYRGQRNYKRV